MEGGKEGSDQMGAEVVDRSGHSNRGEAGVDIREDIQVGVARPRGDRSQDEGHSVMEVEVEDLSSCSRRTPDLDGVADHDTPEEVKVA